ncbi:MAG: glycosyltransferase family 9 protein [Rhodospirillales bacterium]
MALLFITSNRIGDAVLSTGLLTKLMETYPDDGVFVAAGAPSLPLFEAVPQLLGSHAIVKKPRSGHWFDLWKTVAGRRWRAVLDVRRSALPWTVRAQHRYTVPKARDEEHRVESLSRALGSTPLAPTLWIGDSHRKTAHGVIDPSGAYIVVAPGANWIGKTWPAERFAEIVLRLIGPGGLAEGMNALVVGAESEREMTMPLFDRLPADRIVDGIGIGLMPSAAAIEGARLFVGNDSGLMHLAAATGTPTAGLFGPSDDRHYAPWGDNGLVIRTPESLADIVGRPGYDHRNPGCLMESLTVDTVEQALRRRWPSLAR